jgi:hypothetical protein
MPNKDKGAVKEKKKESEKTLKEKRAAKKAKRDEKQK